MQKLQPASEAGVSKKVKLDPEVDTSVKDPGSILCKNYPMARAVDSWRIFPFPASPTYIYLLYKVLLWYMVLEESAWNSLGLVLIVVGAGAAWFGLYNRFPQEVKIK